MLPGQAGGATSAAHSPGGVQATPQRELCLRVQVDTLHGETVFVCGSSPEMGEWQVAGALAMHPEDPATKVWAVRVQVPLQRTVEFRYLVGILLDSGEIIVRRWETVVHPRSIGANELTVDRNAAIDIFGSYDGEERMEPGWLTSESVVQLKMFNSPVVLWKRKYQSLLLSYKVTPIDLAASTADAPAVVEENEQHSNVSDFECVKWPVIEIAVMKEGECEFKHQNQFGNLYAPEDFVVFQAQVLDPTSIAYMVDFYVHPRPEGSLPEHIGFSYVLPGNLREASGSCTVPITGNRHQPVGQLVVSYLIVRPLVGYSCNCRQTFSKLWKKTNRSLDVGHRGAGHARRTDKVENVLENTVASFNYAAKHGADMVELDVQLSKDKVPVIYHDYYICICMKKRKSPVQEEEKLKLAVKDLTACQLQRLKLSPACEGAQQGSSAHGYDFREDDLEDNQPFPTLQHVLEAVDPSVGFNVEIKCPMQFRDGTWEMDLNFDMNQYLDIVLKTLLDFSGKRYIILSCFHPDICTMIRLKQNKYPLLFLTQGQTEKYPAYLDTRTSSVQMATYFAMCTHILGINVHTEELLKQPTLIPFVKQHKLILFCWGEDNNHSGTITCLKRKGVDGVIYDKLDVLIGNSRENENVFLVHPSATVSMLEAAASCSRESQPENTVAATPACSVGSS
ncbi:glycerophosphocholine phosphodiesterase GPCPD1 isoform X2 [Ixodes scapularis]|nr:glycerophosphocholine phosphodiesterase GPCPD1 isoform X2 [Ixodes scapularis]XP_029841463.2 glycerophosphocholine phosphodiesterase GPCPD1 isoform X2 [Ixodes scapularis]XP_029841464.2 glycerophosphocholine phosphodiesterase GPCPD1 isoform X2 [Ixodes scapularis]